MAWFVMQTDGENGFAGDVSTLYDFMSTTSSEARVRTRSRCGRVQHLRRPASTRCRSSSTRPGWRRQAGHASRQLAAPSIARTATSAAVTSTRASAATSCAPSASTRARGGHRGYRHVAVRNGVPVYLRDVGRASSAIRKPGARVFNRGQPMHGDQRDQGEPGSNVFAVMEGVKDTVRRLNAEQLARWASARQVYDETDLHRQRDRPGPAEPARRWRAGGDRAAGLPAQSGTSTLVIAVAIPISMVGAFLAMLLRPHAERDQPGRDGLRRRHGGRQLDRRAGEHLPPPPDG